MKEGRGGIRSSGKPPAANKFPVVSGACAVGLVLFGLIFGLTCTPDRPDRLATHSPPSSKSKGVIGINGMLDADSKVQKAGESQVLSLSITPRSATVLDTLQADVSTVEKSVFLNYQWFKDGKAIPNARDSSLSGDVLTKKCWITVEVQPYSGGHALRPVKSSPVWVFNSSPFIAESKKAIEVKRGTCLEFKVEASDPDGDPITFFLETSVEGMRIDKKTGLLSWQTQGVTSGRYEARVTAVDNDRGRSSRVFTFDVS